MISSRALLAMLVATLASAACGGSWWPFGGGGAELRPRLPAGATEYACAANQTLIVRYTSDGKSAWVIYPDREFRLDRTASDSGDRYTNGVSTLMTEGDETSLEEGGSRLFAACKRKTAGN
jgi:membrane-bound inhibitor of C-type lysozyme